ncbi:unnamed protein product [Closterium sp. NIES-54]
MATITALAVSVGREQQIPHPDTLSPQQLREWVIQRGRPGGGGYVPGGASESATSESAVSAEALHNFTLDSCASRCFFRDCTRVTPLAAPVPVSLADPDYESTAAFALVTELVDFAARSRLDYVATALLRFTSMLLYPEGDPDAFDIPTPQSYAEAIAGTYVDEVPPLGANIVDGMWIFRVKRPPGSPPAFKARYIARGFSQRQGVDFFHTFSPTPKITILRVLLHVTTQHDYELHSLNFSTAFMQGKIHEEIWLRRPPGFTGSFPEPPAAGLRALPDAPRVPRHTTALDFSPSSADPSLLLCTDTSLPLFYERHTCTDLGELRSYLGLQITRDRARRTLTQSHMVHQVLQRCGLTFSSPQPTPLPTSHSVSAPLSDESIDPSGPYPELVGCLICEAEIYAEAMAAQELRWLNYLLSDLGERPHSHPVLYVDNKAMLALCHEQRLEHMTKHIALRYFLARELKQCGQLRLSYVASRANTADVFTKALGSSDHQRFCTALRILPTLPHLLVS